MADGITVALALGAGMISVLAGLALVQWAGMRGRSQRVPVGARPEVEPIAFLFRERRLIDVTGSGRTLIDTLPGEGDWARLWSWLAQRFDSPQRLLETAALQGSATLGGQGGLADLRLNVQDLGHGLVRIEVVDPQLEQAGVTLNAHSLAAMEDELAVLRESVDHAPVLIWREDDAGSVTWANAAYLSAVEAQLTDETRWPLPRLIALPRDVEGVARAQIEGDEQLRWFDCHLQPADGYRTIFAVPADNAVRAERSLREFVQTLTKTFADLPIGLAIFDRDRRLQLFNPALIDLTGLSIGFLTARPTLYALLDGLRELRMVPEPKDYASWRNTIGTLEAEAASGHHVETWTLPGGRPIASPAAPIPTGRLPSCSRTSPARSR
jgi:PAS domain-containing protein